MSFKRVYFIRPVGQTSPVKIGCSHNPVERLRLFNHWSPVPLEVAASAEGDVPFERRLHSMFAESHSHAEWFNISPALQIVIDRIASGETLTEVIGPLDGPRPNLHRLTETSRKSLQARAQHDR